MDTEAVKEELSMHFNGWNMDLNDTVLNKCVELCKTYKIEPEDFVDQWFAFSTTHLRGASPSLEELERMERKELKNSFSASTPSRKCNPWTDVQNNSVSAITSPETPKRNRSVKVADSPAVTGALNKSIANGDDSEIWDYYDETLSSNLVTYSERSDSRSVQTSFGSAGANYKKQKNIEITIKLSHEATINNFKYMYEIMRSKARSLTNTTEWLGQSIMQKNHLKTTDGSWRSGAGDVVTYGRIVSDADGKLNVQSVLLEGVQENLGLTVKLNLGKLGYYSLFPGQVVVVRGNLNPSQNTLIADQIFTDAVPPLLLEPPVINDKMEIVVASGPFTLQGDLKYEPLNDLLKYVIEFEPHLLILIGPFIEDTHDTISDGSFTQKFDSFFETLIQTIMSELQKTNVQVLVVASQRDIHHHPIYPTPPYKIREKYNNLTFLPDPCLVNVNGLVIGATSSDGLLDLGNFEMFKNKSLKKSDRLGRLASHLLQQQSFYPLYPIKDNMYVDHELLDQHGAIDCTPHILILPSNLTHFVKNVNECLVVNPERLAKNYSAGHFARIEISPGSSTSICNRTSCQILRI